MNVYRYKKYNFEKGFLPKGNVWKEPEIFSNTPPVDSNNEIDEDYEQYIDNDYQIDCMAKQYELNAISGAAYVNRLSARVNINIQNNLHTFSESHSYLNDMNPVMVELERGYYHSAYQMMINIVPPPSFEELNNEIKATIKDYVNENYPSVFQIA